jgi:hypothetical protein
MQSGSNRARARGLHARQGKAERAPRPPGLAIARRGRWRCPSGGRDHLARQAYQLRGAGQPQLLIAFVYQLGGLPVTMS